MTCCEKWQELVQWDEGIVPQIDGRIDVVMDSNGPRNWDYGQEGEQRARLKFIYCPYCRATL